MKILQLISSCGFFGAEKVVFELSAELKKSNHTVTIGVIKNEYAPDFDLAEKAAQASLDAQAFACKGKLDFGTISAIAAYAKENSIDIIHSHGYKADIYAFLSNLKRKTHLVATAHNWINTNAKMSLYALADKIVLKQFDAVVSVSRTIESLLTRSGFRREKISLVANGVNIERFHNGHGKVAANGIPHDPTYKIIGTIGRLVKEKGHVHLLDAAPKILSTHKNCIFLFVGDGPLKESLLRQADDHAIRDKVVFLGNRDDIPELLANMDIFVLPSLVESHPMALLEAMAAQKPIVASAVGDIGAILGEGRLGRVVPPGDPSSIAEGVLSYLDNREEAARCGLNAYQEAVEKYSSARMAGEYLKIYHRLN